MKFAVKSLKRRQNRVLLVFPRIGALHRAPLSAARERSHTGIVPFVQVFDEMNSLPRAHIPNIGDEVEVIDAKLTIGFECALRNDDSLRRQYLLVTENSFHQSDVRLR